MTGAVNHISLRWLAVVVAAGFLFGCAGPSVRSLPVKEAARVGAKPGQEAGARSGEKVKGPAKKATVTSKVPVARQPDADAAQPADPPSTDEAIVARPVFHYDYYPDREVYFDTDRHLYFYRTGGEWSMSVALPISFQEHLGASVQLKLESPRPYEYHDQNRRDFPSGTGGRNF